ncbi:MAG: serine/threonine-protein kinase [Planctomycetota bacterium]
MSTEPTPPPPNDPSERLRALLEECLDRIAAEGDAGAEAVLAAHPSHAGVLRARLAKLRESGLLPKPDGDGIPEKLGDFRLLRRLGAGGMGVVYVAEQESLRRQVALKIVRPELLLFPGARERFRREVETIARLDDPGIVHIHQVGEHQGIPYFAMALVEGASLAQILSALRGKRVAELDGASFADVVARQLGESRPEPLPETLRGSWPRACAALMRQMADAVQHAHDMGVVHRDLKPSNAMLRLDGRIVLLDFGLAAPQDAVRITRSGAQLGTLQYMAPEQIRGDAVDARTDVYALGVTLHEMLALSCPFDGDTADSVRSAILGGAQPPIRKHNPDVPRDLETICRRAMDLAPERRYPSAAAFADDLGRFLEHRTIEARRAGPALIAARFLRRHPAVAAVLASLPFLFGGTLVAIERVRVEMESEVVSVRGENSRLEAEASTNLQSALAAIAVLAKQVEDPTLKKTPGLDSLRAEQIEQVVKLLRRIRSGPAPSVELRRNYARGLVMAGELWRSLGDGARAEIALQEAERELRADDLAGGGSPSDRTALASALASRAHVFRERGDVEQCVALWNETIAILDPLVTADHPDARALELLASTLADRGLIAQSQNHLVDAEHDYTRSLEFDEKVLVAGERRDLRVSMLRTRSNHAALLLATGRTEAARQAFAAMAEDAKKLLDADPADPEARREFARAHAGIAKTAQALGDGESADAAMETSLTYFAALAHDFPQRTQYRWEHGMAEYAAGELARRMHDGGAAIAHYTRAIAAHEELQKLVPDRIDTLRELAAMHGNLGLVLENNGTLEAARSESDRTLALQDEVARSPHADLRDRRDVALAHYNRALQRRKLEDVDGVLADLEVALPILEEKDPATGRPFDPHVLGSTYRVLAECRTARHDAAGAVAALRLMQECEPTDHANLRQLVEVLELGDRDDCKALLEAARGK